MEQESIYLIINKHLSGDSTVEEERILDSWLKESEENKQQLSDLTRLWRVTGKMHLELDLDTASAWNKITGRMQTGGRIRSIRPFHLFKAAASLLALLALGALFYLLVGEPGNTYQTAANERKHLILPDKSEVWLNQNSRLEYDDDFSQERGLRLVGEAFFEVVSDSTKPFTVETNDMLTTVVGTSFNVTARKRDPQQEVTVISGKVKVSTDNHKSEVFLEPGTKVVFNMKTHRLVKSSNRNINFLAWKERELHFRNTPLNQVRKALEDYFNIKLKLEQPGLGTCQFTGDFDDPVLEEVFEVLSITLELSIVQENDEYSITGAGCTKIQN